MNKKQIETKIADAISEMKSNDGFEKISREISNVSQERKVVVMKERNNISLRKVAYACIAACLVLAIGLFGFSYYGNNIAVDSIIDIDVNPSIEIKANKSDKVLDVVAINNDGAQILDGMELKNVDIKVAVNAVIGSMVKKGYFSEIDSGILVSVQNKDSEKAERIKSEILKDIDAQFEENNLSAPIINQAVAESSNDEAEKFAADNKISYGKAVFILSLAKKDASLDAKELAKLNIYEIAKLVSEKSIDIKDIVDYEYDDSIFENIEDQIEDTNEDRYEDDDGNKPVDTSGLISKEKAKSIALNHAGVKAASASFIKVELGSDDGVREYEVDFRVGNVKYDYEVRATDGKILEADKDIDYYDDDDDNVAVNNSSAKYISVESAKSKALSHAGVKAANAVFERTELDIDDGVAKYEVEFNVGKVEYSYDINAITGAVIEFDKDIDD